MRLTRVYVEGELTPGSVVELPPDTAAHLAKVLRARSGDELILFNGDGREFTGAIEAVRGARVSAAVGDSRSVDRESPFAITLVQCVPRGDRMDFIVQKATELGVARIVPVLSQRSVVRLDQAQRTIESDALAGRGRERLRAMRPQSPSGGRSRRNRCSITSASRLRAPGRNWYSNRIPRRMRSSRAARPRQYGRNRDWTGRRLRRR